MSLTAVGQDSLCTNRYPYVREPNTKYKRYLERE